jgi:hypothetical protein
MVGAFSTSHDLERFRAIIGATAGRVEQASRPLEQANEALDAAESYAPNVVALVESAYQTVALIFDEERRASEQAHSLGPMLPAGFHEARRVFLGDLMSR